MRVAQADWEAKYGPMAGPVNMGWAMDRVKAANDPRLTNANVKIQEEWNNYIDTIPNLTNEYKSTLKMLPLIASGEIFGAKITQGDDGNLQVVEMDKQEKEDQLKTTVAGIRSGQKPIKGISKNFFKKGLTNIRRYIKFSIYETVRII